MTSNLAPSSQEAIRGTDRIAAKPDTGRTRLGEKFHTRTLEENPHSTRMVTRYLTWQTSNTWYGVDAGVSVFSHLRRN